MSDPTEVIEVTAPPEVVEVTDATAEETVVVEQPLEPEVVEVDGVIEVLDLSPSVVDVVEIPVEPVTVEVIEDPAVELVEVGGTTVIQPQNTFIQATDPGAHAAPILWVKLNPAIPGDISLVLRTP